MILIAKSPRILGSFSRRCKLNDQLRRDFSLFADFNSKKQTTKIFSPNFSNFRFYSTIKPEKATISTEDELLSLLGEKPSVSESSVKNVEIDEDYIDMPPAALSEFKELRPFEDWEMMVNPLAWCQKLFEFSHNTLDLSWATTIIGTAILVKLLSVKLYTVGEKFFVIHHNNLKTTADFRRQMKILKEQDDKKLLQEKNKEFIKFAQKEAKLPTTFQQMKILLAKFGLVFTQICTVHRLAESNSFNMFNENFLWITHMALPDPSHTLPMISSTIMFIYFSDKIRRGYVIKNNLDRIHQSALVLVCGMISLSVYHGFLVYAPAATNLCIATNFLLSAAILALLRVPYVRTKLKFADVKFHATSEISKAFGRFLLKETTTPKVVEDVQVAQKRLQVLRDIQKMQKENPMKFKDYIQRLKTEEAEAAKKQAVQK